MASDDRSEGSLPWRGLLDRVERGYAGADLDREVGERAQQVGGALADRSAAKVDRRFVRPHARTGASGEKDSAEVVCGHRSVTRSMMPRGRVARGNLSTWCYRFLNDYYLLDVAGTLRRRARSRDTVRGGDRVLAGVGRGRRARLGANGSAYLVLACGACWSSAPCCGRARGTTCPSAGCVTMPPPAKDAVATLPLSITGGRVPTKS